MNKLTKQQTANVILAQSWLYIYLDPRVEGVVVPPWLQHKPTELLHVGYNMPIPIPDLRVDEDGISGTLSFSMTPYACFIPWRAVFALTTDDKRGNFWEEDMPADAVPTKDPPKSSTKTKRPLPPYLRVVK